MYLRTAVRMSTTVFMTNDRPTVIQKVAVAPYSRAVLVTEPAAECRTYEAYKAFVLAIPVRVSR